MYKNKLKQLRLSCALTQKQVSDAIGIDRSTYTCYETGKSNPPIETAKKLSRIFNVTLEEIFFDENIDAVSTILSENNINYNASDEPEINFLNLIKDEKDLIIRFRLMDIEKKKKLLEEAAALLGGSSD